MSDDYAHPIGQVSKALVQSGVDLQRQAEAAAKAGDHDHAEKLGGEAEQHLKIANDLDILDEHYGERNKV